jgi:hypothetical protein
LSLGKNIELKKKQVLTDLEQEIRDQKLSILNEKLSEARQDFQQTFKAYNKF